MEVYPLAVPYPGVAVKLMVEPIGLVLAVVLLILGPIGVLVDVLLALIVYDRYNRIMKIIREAGA